ncbi:Dihydrolipoyllysine-residue acetyltransferase component of pyruvate dehydrogenase complex [Anaerohalosphaera lusitana]|uniref:Dihydrolipoyllysine-residue acetyltransferase component of pyruvate dehydrogenase complex n=1 Tax=Anaerohalosphaera lusitana TaxID=1936003 RepID=A0A1U9NGT9_9BACT|nr:2-oxo acid dehydrogenase subunit E2 [Anaerohalosphaera lusitana]AQT67025.1 Dihydrolipoyllysine-residue acetyltransferase component of pyruvate dehydrogenase complex [Anaerohalosphaera lusitana]
MQNKESISDPHTQMPLTRIQKLIGGYMHRSKREKPCCYMECTADLTDLVKLRKRFSRQAGIRITTNDFFIAAIGHAIAEFPLFAGRMDETGDFIETTEQTGVGFAVAAPQGLVVPVVKDVSSKSLAQVSADSDHLLRKARSNKLDLDDFDGANVVLSGLGMFGVTSFIAIAPPEAVGIISIGKIVEKALPVDGEIAPRRTMSITLAADMRIVSESYAARFLRRIVDMLENPTCMTSL